MYTESFCRAKSFTRAGLAVLFVGAGMLHFIRPEMYVPIVPPALPDPLLLVYVSGVFEVLGGIGMLIPAKRRWAGYGLVLLLLAVYPANIYMATHGVTAFGEPLPAWFHWIRLPMQFVLIALVLWSTHAAQKEPSPATPSTLSG